MRIGWVAVTLVVGATCWPSVATATVRSGSVTDPVEGTAATGRDLTRASASYDDSTGGLAATVRFAGPVSADAAAEFKVWFKNQPQCAQSGVVELVGSTGEPAAHVESDLFRHPPPGFAVVPDAPDADWSLSADGREITVSYTDGRFAGLDLTHTRVDVYQPPVSFDFTADCLWFEGFAPAAIKRISDVRTAKGAVSEVVDVAQANSAVTASLRYKGKTVGSRAIQAADGGQLPITVSLTRAGHKLLKGNGKRAKHRQAVTLVTTVTPSAAAPPPQTMSRSVSVTF